MGLQANRAEAPNKSLLATLVAMFSVNHH